MPITYDLKQRIMTSLAQEQDWQTHDFTAIFADNSRKGCTRYISMPEGLIRLNREDDLLPDHPQFFLKEGIQSAAFLKTLDFPFDQWPGLQPYELINAIKLIVARDLNLEPQLKCANVNTKPGAVLRTTLSLGEVSEASGSSRDFNSASLIKKAVMLPMKDSTDFIGYYIETPTRFAVEADEKFVRLSTTSDYAEALITQTALWLRQQAQATPPGNSSLPLIEQLSNGVADSGFRSGEWIGIVQQTSSPVEAVQAAHALLQDNLHLPFGRFAIVNSAKAEVFVAVHKQTFEKAQVAYEATKLLVNAIYKGLPEGRTADEFLKAALDAGADLKYVDFAAARSGATLAQLMEKKHSDLLPPYIKLRNQPQIIVTPPPAP